MSQTNFNPEINIWMQVCITKILISPFYTAIVSCLAEKVFQITDFWALTDLHKTINIKLCLRNVQLFYIFLQVTFIDESEQIKTLNK
jgi:hypothetical protein